MKKIIIVLGILILSGCGLAKVDLEQNDNLQVVVQAHNALVTKLDSVIKATEKAFGSNIARRQDIFREALATPVPTPVVEAK